MIPLIYNSRKCKPISRESKLVSSCQAMGFRGKELRKFMRKPLKVLGVLIISSGMLFHECTHMLKLKLYTLNLCGLLFGNYTSIYLKCFLKNKSPPTSKIFLNLSIFFLGSMSQGLSNSCRVSGSYLDLAHSMSITSFPSLYHQDSYSLICWLNACLLSSNKVPGQWARPDLQMETMLQG